MGAMDSLAHFLAEALNPLFVLLLLGAPFVGHRPRAAEVLPFYLASALGLAVAVLLAEAGKQRVVWPGHPGFPSGHETFALACATSLLCWRRGWLWAVLPLAVAMGWALVVAGYHQPVEVLGALLTGPPSALLCHAWRLRRRNGQRPTAAGPKSS